MRSLSQYQFQNSAGCPAWVVPDFVFPHFDDLPAQCLKLPLVQFVAFDVPLKLSPPERAVGLGRGVVLRTAVPPAPMNEDRELGFLVDEIWPTGESRNDQLSPELLRKD